MTHSQRDGGVQMQVTTIGIDLAKHVFQIHGVDARGKRVLTKKLRRDQMKDFFAQQPACRIGLEACAGAHYWARELGALGHTVRLMAPQFVKPYVKTNKSDAADAEAICEAVDRPNMRFVPVKTPDQQAVLALHRVREGWIKARTAQSNQIRGLLAEFGIVLPQGLATLYRRVPGVLEDAENGLPDMFRDLLADLLAHIRELDDRVKRLERRIHAWHRQHPISQRLAQIPGIGPISASALVASIGEARAFRNGRQLAAWLGPGAQAALHRWQGQPVGYQQARRPLPAHAADPWCTLSPSGRQSTCREWRPVAGRVARASLR